MFCFVRERDHKTNSVYVLMCIGAITSTVFSVPMVFKVDTELLGACQCIIIHHRHCNHHDHNHHHHYYPSSSLSLSLSLPISYPEPFSSSPVITIIITHHHCHLSSASLPSRVRVAVCAVEAKLTLQWCVLVDCSSSIPQLFFKAVRKRQERRVIAAPRSLKLTIGKYVWGWMG